MPRTKHVPVVSQAKAYARLDKAMRGEDVAEYLAARAATRKINGLRPLSDIEAVAGWNRQRAHLGLAPIEGYPSEGADTLSIRVRSERETIDALTAAARRLRDSAEALGDRPTTAKMYATACDKMADAAALLYDASELLR